MALQPDRLALIEALARDALEIHKEGPAAILALRVLAACLDMPGVAALDDLSTRGLGRTDPLKIRVEITVDEGTWSQQYGKENGSVAIPEDLNSTLTTTIMEWARGADCSVMVAVGYEQSRPDA